MRKRCTQRRGYANAAAKAGTLPMRQVANRQLWIGNAGDLRDPRALFAAGIEAVVELADSEPLALLPRELIRLRFPLSDGGDNADWLIRLAVQSVAALVKAHVPALICCSGGMGRSVCVVDGALAIAENRTFDDVLVALTATGPADVSPALLLQFRAAISAPRN